jgi:hypothetical protein
MVDKENDLDEIVGVAVVDAPGFDWGPFDYICERDVGIGNNEIHCRTHAALPFHHGVLGLGAEGFGSREISGEQMIEHSAFSWRKGSRDWHGLIVRRR